MEMESVLHDCKDRSISFCFDGTTDVAEVINIVVRFVTDCFKITQRVLALKLLSKSLDANELARFLVDTIILEKKIEKEHIHAAIRDGAPVNEAALNSLTFYFSTCAFPICLSHSANTAGAEIKKTADNARCFISCWSLLISHCNHARMLFKEHSGVSVERLGKVRWFTLWEVGAHINDYYSCVKSVIYDTSDFAQQSRDSCKTYIENNETILLLKLALIKDIAFVV